MGEGWMRRVRTPPWILVIALLVRFGREMAGGGARRIPYSEFKQRAHSEVK
jgi:hypothetical protein